MKGSVDNAAKAARALLDDFAKSNIERLRVLLLDKNKEMICKKIVKKGGDKDVVFKISDAIIPVIKHKASFVILSHNHPSGILLPSEDDITMTTKMNEIYKTIGADLLDHIIFAPNGKWISLKELGVVPCWTKKRKRAKSARSLK